MCRMQTCKFNEDTAHRKTPCISCLHQSHIVDHYTPRDGVLKPTTMYEALRLSKDSIMAKVYKAMDSKQAGI